MTCSAVLPTGWVYEAAAREILDRLDAGARRHDHLEILRIERRDVADVVGRPLERLTPLDRVHGRDRVAEAEVGVAVLDALDVGDAAAGHDEDRREAGILAKACMAPPSGYHAPPWGPVIRRSCWACAGMASAVTATAAVNARQHFSHRSFPPVLGLGTTVAGRGRPFTSSPSPPFEHNAMSARSQMSRNWSPELWADGIPLRATFVLVGKFGVARHHTGRIGSAGGVARRPRARRPVGGRNRPGRRGRRRGRSPGEMADIVAARGVHTQRAAVAPASVVERISTIMASP